MDLDSEVDILKTVYEKLGMLDHDGRRRCLEWLHSKFEDDRIRDADIRRAQANVDISSTPRRRASTANL